MSNKTYFPSKNFKKNNIRVIKRKRIPFSRNKLFLALTFILVLFITLLILGYSYFNNEARITRYIEEKKYAEALKIIKSVLNKENNNAFALKAKASIYFLYSTNHDYLKQNNSSYIDITIESLKKLIKTNNKEYLNSDIYFMLGYSFFLKSANNEDLLKKALFFLEKSVDLNIQDQKILNYINNPIWLSINNRKYTISFNGLLGYISYQLEEYDRAISYFEKSVKEKSAEVIYHLYLALAYTKIENYDKAVDEFETVILKEKNADVKMSSYFYLSNIFLKKNEYQLARKYIFEAQKYKTSAEGYYKLGITYEEDNQIQTAMKYWKKAIQLDKDHDGARRKLIRYEKKFEKKKD